MASISSTSYTPPGVYTDVVLSNDGATLQANARIPVLIGEGEEFLTTSNQEVHRGSSAVADDLAAGENISDQADGTTRTFQLSHYPVVSGDGTGTVTNDPSKVTLSVNDVAVVVLSLNGATGQITTQTLILPTDDAKVSYYFKRTDTEIENEDLSFQVPSFAALTLTAGQDQLVLSLSVPGALGNQVSLALTQASSGAGVSDAQAVTGAGTDSISIELRKAGGTLRTLTDIANLVNSGIVTLSAGYLTASATASTSSPAAAGATHFANGAGQNTNTVFKTKHVPIVDGTNGGVVTTNPSDVTIKVNGSPVTVSAVDGSTGFITLAQPVLQGQTLEGTYFTNTYQNTSDELPASDVAAVTKVGYGPDRSDFVQGVDYVLDGNNISWGASVKTAADKTTSGSTPLDATSINTTLVDEKVYLQLCSGASSGKNSVFSLPDTPVDGSGLGRATDDPTLISVYVGVDPYSALVAGPVKVARVSGASATVTLFNPAPQGSNVYATYYRNTLNDHMFSVAVKVAGSPSVGTYSVTNELGQVIPSAKLSGSSVEAANFANTGLVWPSSFSDLSGGIGAPEEVVSLTFQDDGLTRVMTPAIQASLTVADGNSVPRITFRATTPGVGGNAVTIALVGGPSGAADASAITITSNAISVKTVKADGTTTRSWQDIVNLFQTYPPTIAGAGTILCTGVTGADLSAQATSIAATALAGGAAAISAAYANRFKVTSSRTLNDATADGLGRTGGATTPSGPNTGNNSVGANGYLGQTYIDPATGLKFTIVDPANALSYGYTQLPSPSYSFAPGDTLTFSVSRTLGHVTGATIVAIPGLRTKVVTTLNMTVGDTAAITTYNKAGNVPEVGEFYYVSYTTNKSDADFALKTFTSDKAAYALYGQPSETNRLSLGIKLFLANGPTQFACIQVKKQAGLGLASDQAFVDAISSLAMPFDNGRKVDVVLPLSSSPTVQQAVSVFLTKQATPRNKGEATSFVGFSRQSKASSVASGAKSIGNRRVVAVAPWSWGLMVQPDSNAAAYEIAVGGEFMAAAVAGLALSSQNDEATTLAGQKVVGFTRPLVKLDAPTMNTLAVAGVTVLTPVSGGLEVRDYLTTDTSSELASLPYVTTITDFISKGFRAKFKPWTGRKVTPDVPSSMQVIGNEFLKGMVNDKITAYAPCSVTVDKNDPTTINVEVSYVPMFSTRWININFSVNLSSN